MCNMVFKSYSTFAKKTRLFIYTCLISSLSMDWKPGKIWQSIKWYMNMYQSNFDLIFASQTRIHLVRYLSPVHHKFIWWRTISFQTDTRDRSSQGSALKELNALTYSFNFNLILAHLLILKIILCFVIFCRFSVQW